MRTIYYNGDKLWVAFFITFGWLIIVQLIFGPLELAAFFVLLWSMLFNCDFHNAQMGQKNLHTVWHSIPSIISQKIGYGECCMPVWSPQTQSRG